VTGQGTKRLRNTHRLLSAEGGMSLNTESKSENEGHPHTIKHEGKDELGYQK
jgi:hypothetical protein